jgi:hypothetical protein
MRWLPLVSALVIIGVQSVTAQARPVSHPQPDWPCVQRKVPTLSAGSVWSGPALDEKAAEAWRDDPVVAAFVPKLVSRRTAEEELPKLIEEFAAGLKEQKAEKLTLTFAGAFAEINTLRSEVIRGIGRYAKNQGRRSGALKATRESLDALQAKPEKSEADNAKIAELTDQAAWQTRIFDDREAMSVYVCELPVLLEQRIFTIGREIQSKLP